MANTEILAAITEFQSTIEGQILATNATLKEFMSSFDSRFADLLSTPPSPSPAAAFYPVFRSGGSSTAHQQRCLPNAPLQHPGSAAPPPFLSFDVTSVAASTTSAAASTSFSAAPPPFLSFDVTSAAASTSIAAATNSDDTTTLYQTTGNADSVHTAILAAPTAASSVNLTALLLVELFGKAPSPAPGPAPEFTPPPNSHFRPMPPTPQPTAPSASPSPTKAALALLPPQATSISFSHFQVLGHSTKVAQISKNILWPSPSDMEAQSNSFNKYQDDVAVASRRGVIFSLYALEEVYKDILESPP